MLYIYFGDKLSHYITVIGSLSLLWCSYLLVLLVLSSLQFGSAHDLLPACHIVMPVCEKGQHLIPCTDFFSSDHWEIVLRSIPLFPGLQWNKLRPTPKLILSKTCTNPAWEISQNLFLLRIAHFHISDSFVHVHFSMIYCENCMADVYNERSKLEHKNRCNRCATFGFMPRPGSKPLFNTKP